MKTHIIEGPDGDFMITSHGQNLADMEEADRIEYWQKLGDQAIFKAALEMIGSYCLENGIDPKIDRNLEHHSKTLSEK